MIMRLFLVLIIFCSLGLTSCLKTPELKEIKGEQKKSFESIKKSLGLERIGYSYTRKVTESIDRLYFQIHLVNINRTNLNYDSLNTALMKIFDDSGYELSKCYRVSIFYFTDYDNAKAARVYFFDSEKRLVRIAYE